MSAPLTETEVTQIFVQPKDGETLPSLLKRCINPIQTKRAIAYNRLEQALRTSQPNVQRVNPPPFNAHPPDEDYRIACANVTEDLKLCSEAVLELRSILSSHTLFIGPLRETDPLEVANVISWLDKLQDLEERKLVATVSKHVLARSNSLPDSSASNGDTLSVENINEKVSKYARELCHVDEMINDILQEMREYFLEHDDR